MGGWGSVDPMLSSNRPLFLLDHNAPKQELHLPWWTMDTLWRRHCYWAQHPRNRCGSTEREPALVPLTLAQALSPSTGGAQHLLVSPHSKEYGRGECKQYKVLREGVEQQSWANSERCWRIAMRLYSKEHFYTSFKTKSKHYVPFLIFFLRQRIKCLTHLFACRTKITSTYELHHISGWFVCAFTELTVKVIK